MVSRMVDIVMIRTYEHTIIERFASQSRVPVVNGLTDFHHPCQVLADLFTLYERRKPLDELRIAFVGDGNNVVHSWLEAATLYRFTFALACPPGYEPDTEILARCRVAGANIEITNDVHAAVQNADVVYTDVWTSMGQETQREQRLEAFQRYQVNEPVMRFARPRALVMHCLPAHRGEEITDVVLDGETSIVLDQAENRLHAQKAVILDLLGASVDDA